MYRAYSLFLISFVLANLIVKQFGATGLWISSFLLIPFDFTIRCIIHERLSGMRLFATLFALTCSAALVTVVINWHATSIAIASVCGFCAAQLAAGIFYQRVKLSTNWFYKVNVSDLLAIIFDSFIFQLVAFSSLDIKITAGQVIIKFLGGLMWYYILFKVVKIQHKKIIQVSLSGKPQPARVSMDQVNRLKQKFNHEKSI